MFVYQSSGIEIEASKSEIGAMIGSLKSPFFILSRFI